MTHHHTVCIFLAFPLLLVPSFRAVFSAVLVHHKAHVIVLLVQLPFKGSTLPVWVLEARPLACALIKNHAS